jgi:hypothetical protein
MRGRTCSRERCQRVGSSLPVNRPRPLRRSTTQRGAPGLQRDRRGPSKKGGTSRAGRRRMVRSGRSSRRLHRGSGMQAHRVWEARMPGLRPSMVQGSRLGRSPIRRGQGAPLLPARASAGGGCGGGSGHCEPSSVQAACNFSWNHRKNSEISAPKFSLHYTLQGPIRTPRVVDVDGVKYTHRGPETLLLTKRSSKARLCHLVSHWD